MFKSSFILMCFLLIIYFIHKYIVDKKWNDKPLRNFPFIHHGKEYWYSRSVACVLLCFCKNKQGDWCVLANKRGEKTPDYQGYWNIPCGYLDFDESGEECVQRECYEETNVFIPLNKIQNYGVSTDINNNRQNVSIRYFSIIEDTTCETYQLSDKNSEDGEVSDIKWIPINEIDSYKWAFNHDSLIKYFNKLSIIK